MKRNQKGSSTILVIITIIVLLVAGLYLLRGKTTSPSSYETNQQTPTSANQMIQGDNDLTNASNDLDNTNVDTTVDTELSQNDTEAI